MEKADLRGENEHAPPANRGPTGNGQDGGRRGELLHLTKVWLFFPAPLRGRDEKRPVEIEAESIRKLKDGHANHCVCQVEVMEQRRTGGDDKRRGFRRCDD